MTPPSPASPAFFHALGQAVDAAWSVGLAEAAGAWVQAFTAAHAAGEEVVAWDRYGRCIGRARMRRVDAGAELVEAWLPRGGLRPWVGMVVAELRRRELDGLRVTRRGRIRWLGLDRLSRLAAPAPDRSTPLHPVLAGMAAADATEAVALGQAVALLAADARHAALPVAEMVRRLKRARGCGQLRLWTHEDGRPRGLLLWARPSAALLAALGEGRDERFHAEQWQVGGEPVVLELCAADADTAGEVAAAAVALLAVDEPRLHVRLADGRGQARLAQVPRAELDDFARWLASALLPCC